MTLRASLACFRTSSDCVAFPATLVNNHFCAECFIRNIDWVGAMAFRTYVSLLFHLFRFIMTNLALDRRGFEIIRMRSIQCFGIYLMMARDTFDLEILYVHLVMKYDFTG